MIRFLLILAMLPLILSGRFVVYDATGDVVGGIQQIGLTVVTTVNNATSTDCASPADTQADDILVVFFSKDDDPDVTPDTGWDTAVELGVTTDEHHFAGIYWELLTGAADATYTFTHDREATICTMIALRGVNTTNVTDIVGSFNDQTATANPQANTITTTVRATGPNVWAMHGHDSGGTPGNCSDSSSWDGEATDTINNQIAQYVYYKNEDPDGATGNHLCNTSPGGSFLSVQISFEDDDPPT